MSLFVSVVLVVQMCLTPVLAIGQDAAKPAMPNQFPWMVRIDALGIPAIMGQFCGGSLLRTPGNDDQSDIVVTAGHCRIRAEDGLSTRPEPNLVMVLGAHARTDAIEKSRGFATSEKRRIKRILSHPKLNSNTAALLEYDIALIQLDAPVKFSARVQPIDLPKRGDILDAGDKCTVAGWGALIEIKDEMRGTRRYKFPDVLMYANVTISSERDCRSAWQEHDNEHPFNYDSAYCVSPAVSAPATTCDHDSGGPLFCKKNNHVVVHGIVSHGDPVNCEEGRTIPQRKPDRLTKIESHLDWIEKTIREWSG